MEQENKIESNRVDNENEINKEGGDHQHHSHHAANTHQTSHSHHSSHSRHHSKHRHGSSHGKRSKKSKRSLINKLQLWLDKKLGRNGIAIVSLCVVIVLLVMINFLHLAEINDWGGKEFDENQGDHDYGYNGTEGVNNNSSMSGYTIPSYWNDMVEVKTKIVKLLQTAGGKDCVSFVWASDTHIPDNDTTRTNDLGKIMAKMMDDCDIPFAVITGDVGTRASYPTETELAKTQESIPDHLAPLWGTNRLLVALGNHDGCYGDSSNFYAKQLSPEKMWQFYFRNQSLDSRRIFSDDGTYFYVDNQAQKVRYIVLNSQFGGQYSVDGNGVAVNNRFSVSCYGQEQLEWLANVALDMPEGYGAIITSHVPANIDYTVDRVQLIGIINAYCNKTSYSGGYSAGIDGWTNNYISVNFENAEGEIIAMFSGHVHQDTVDTTTLACPLITIISAGAQVNDGEVPVRTMGSDTETSFDIVTINRKTRTIYCTRVGAGEDRKIQY